MPILDTPLDNAELAIPPWSRSSVEPDIFFEMSRMFRHLRGYDFVDVVTYTVNANPNLNVRKLIVAFRPKRDVKFQKGVLVYNNHAKIFYCYDRPQRLRAVYVGSGNYIGSRNHNVNVRVEKARHKPLLEFFEYLWKNGKAL